MNLLEDVAELLDSQASPETSELRTDASPVLAHVLSSLDLVSTSNDTTRDSDELLSPTLVSKHHTFHHISLFHLLLKLQV